jgi:hypothetical protein
LHSVNVAAVNVVITTPTSSYRRQQQQHQPTPQNRLSCWSFRRLQCVLPHFAMYRDKSLDYLNFRAQRLHNERVHAAKAGHLCSAHSAATKIRIHLPSAKNVGLLSP